MSVRTHPAIIVDDSRVRFSRVCATQPDGGRRMVFHRATAVAAATP